MVVLSACSDEKSEIAEYKENFVNTCVVASGNRKVKRQMRSVQFVVVPTIKQLKNMV
ncbi:hypothetical protein LHK12_06200 [Providencia rettgeri]|nr:hypothetical protein [Providencia rettgeri]